MSTATTAIPLGNGAGSTERARSIVHESFTSMAASSPAAAARTAVTAVATWVRTTSSRLGLDRAYTTARGYVTPALSWARGLLATAGPANVVAFSLTTHRGRDLVLHTVPGRVYGTTKRVIGFPLRPVRSLLLRFSFGRKIVGSVLGGLMLAEAFVSDIAMNVDTWLADRHSTPAMRWVRSALFFVVTSRIIRRFVPTGWLRLLLQGATVLIPTTSVGANNDEMSDSVLATAIDTTLELVGSPKVTAATEDLVDSVHETSPAKRVVDVPAEPVMRANDVAAAAAEAAAGTPGAPAPMGNRAARRSQGQRGSGHSNSRPAPAGK